MNVPGGPKRLQNELEETMEMKNFAQVQLLHAENDNIFRWVALLLPTAAPYNLGSYRLEIDFPKRYPFKPPILHIPTKVYHPNINHRGQLCIPILVAEQWKPTSRMSTVLNVVLATFNDPQAENVFCPEIAGQFLNNYNQFYKTAEAWVLRYADKRPTDRQLRQMKKALANKR